MRKEGLALGEACLPLWYPGLPHVTGSATQQVTCGLRAGEGPSKVLPSGGAWPHRNADHGKGVCAMDSCLPLA
jgi:hypothetical protein